MKAPPSSGAFFVLAIKRLKSAPKEPAIDDDQARQDQGRVAYSNGGNPDI